MSLVVAISTILACNPYQRTIHLDHQDGFIPTIVEEIAIHYPFTGHKAIDWTAFGQELNTRLPDKRLDDLSYLKIRELIYNLPDGRINIQRQDDTRLREQELGGYLGFDMAIDQDGNYRVIHIDSSSHAWEKGLRPLNKIVGWKGETMEVAAQNENLRWGYHPAGIELRELLLTHFLTRGAVGQSVDLYFENNTGNTRGIRLVFETSAIQYVPDFLSMSNSSGGSGNRFEILDNNIASLRLNSFTPADLGFFNQEVKPNLMTCEGLIIDLRENEGGHDAIAAQIAASFSTQEWFYEEVLVKSVAGDEWQSLGHVHVEPTDNPFTKPVILVIGPLCIGPGERFSQVLQQETHIQSLGAWNTMGSFSFPGGSIKIPGCFELHYPIGMSIDESGVILIEAPGEYGGGVYPDIRLNLDAAHLAAMESGYDILFEEAKNHLLR